MAAGGRQGVEGWQGAAAFCAARPSLPLTASSAARPNPHTLPAGGSSSSSGGSGGGGSVTVVERRPLGSLVHVFSHIRMTMKVERILLQVCCVVLWAADASHSPGGHRGAACAGWDMRHVLCQQPVLVHRRSSHLSMHAAVLPLPAQACPRTLSLGYLALQSRSHCNYRVYALLLRRVTSARQTVPRTRLGGWRRCNGCPAARCRAKG